jgi:hypothetical protein
MRDVCRLNNLHNRTNITIISRLGCNKCLESSGPMQAHMKKVAGLGDHNPIRETKIWNNRGKRQACARHG